MWPGSYPIWLDMAGSIPDHFTELFAWMSFCLDEMCVWCAFTALWLILEQFFSRNIAHFFVFMSNGLSLELFNQNLKELTFVENGHQSPLRAKLSFGYTGTRFLNNREIILNVSSLHLWWLVISTSGLFLGDDCDADRPELCFILPTNTYNEAL